MSLFERIKNIRYDLQENKKFPGDESGAYKQAKIDLETRKGFKKNKPGGLKADEKNPYVKRSVRKSRVDKLGGDIYDQPKFTQKGFEKSLKKVEKLAKTPKYKRQSYYRYPLTDPFPASKGDTPGEIRVKGLDRKAYKKTKPSDVKLPQTFKDFGKKLRRLKSDIQDVKDKDIATMRTGKSSSKVKVSGGENLTRQDVGMAPPNTPKKSKGVKQSEVSKKAKDFTKQVNQKRVIKGDGKVTNSKGIGNMYRGNSPEARALRKQAIDARSGSGVVVRDKVTMSDRVNKGFTKGPTPKVSSKVITGVTAGGKPSYATKSPFIKDASLGRAVSKEITKNPTSRLLQTKNLPYLKAASKQKGILRGATRFLGKLGPKGRLIAGGITAALATPGGRNFAKNLALGAGLTGLGLGGKKEKVLKKGDGLKPIGKVDVRYGLTGTSKKGQGGKVYDPKQMAQVGKVQKKFIDKYNQKASKNPFKKQIQYKAKGDGTYKVLDPKKK